MKSLEAINGIGPAIAREMAKFGVASIEELVAMRPDFAAQLARNVEGLSLRQLVGDYRPQARLLMVTGVTTDMAAALVDGGYLTYRRVVFADPAELLQALPRKPKGLETPADVMTLQLACARAQYFDRVIVRVSDAQTGKPITNARLTMRDAGQSARSTADVEASDAQGWIISPACARGRAHRVLVDAPGYRRTSFSVEPKGGTIHKLHLGLSKGQVRADADEFVGQSLGVIPAGAFVSVEVMAAGAVPAGSIWRLQSKNQTGQATLECLMRRRFGPEIRVYTTKLALTELQAPTTIGKAYEAVAGAKWRKPARGTLSALTARREQSGRRAA
jgi:predicted flap endonuclease-1-like 5' DNA nuclease